MYKISVINGHRIFGFNVYKDDCLIKFDISLDELIKEISEEDFMSSEVKDAFLDIALDFSSFEEFIKYSKERSDKINSEHQKRIEKFEVFDILGNKLNVGDYVVCASSMSNSGASLDFAKVSGIEKKDFVNLDYFESKNPKKKYTVKCIYKRGDKLLKLSDKTFEEFRKIYLEEEKDD